MPSKKNRSTTLALFCKVVDNYGDIGICWRLAKQLEQEHSIAVTLWVDDLRSFQRICPAVDTGRELQQVDNITVQHWRGQGGEFAAEDIADIVIEFFACDIPPGYIAAMARCEQRPVWLNLEGLTAETWVEGCHTLPSPHPSLSLTKYFFFPGFTRRTGGLLREASLEELRLDFQSRPAHADDFLARFGMTPAEISSLKVSLFCYPQAPVSALFQAWQTGGRAVTCLVPEGVATEALETFLGIPAKAGATATHGALTVRVLPFIPQPDYDKLLWSCDVNFVRGEDSFVRAQWAGKPFIWHIYPQDENLHHVKLKAFLQAYTPATAGLLALSYAWNGVTAGTVNWTETWPDFAEGLSGIAREATNWQNLQLANGDLASNLLKFANAMR
ncbi:elongation factor P maturation arginine rhamnosyltransferase EarP [Undibacterium sp. TJN25]|uniref:elongation factor P maturation arginine rhamnosyltransferase EarP n=1 Tax=Undibacterium sp. TJN25 TaxID=3413056 RepID=UPI003BF2AF5C